MIKVVEVISDMNIGGAGTLLLNRLSYYDRSVFKEYVIIPKGSKLKKRLLDIGVSVFEIDGCYDRSFDASAILQISAIIKKIKPHILNAHGALSARIAALLSRVPIRIYTRHCAYPPSKIFRFPPVKQANRLFCSILSDKIIAVARIAKENLIDMGASPKRIAVIINGASPLKRSTDSEKIKLKEALGFPRDTTVVTICARLEPCKDHVTFLRAARILSEHYPDYRFLIIGSGSLEKTLKEKAKKLGVDQAVVFTGFLDDTSPYMNITDVNVNCSIGTETSSLAISEGMSLGIPCVASDYGGNPYMVRDGKNGYIFRQRDALDLARKIMLLRDKNIYSSLSLNAILRFKNELNAKTMTKKTEKLYISLIKNLQT